MHDTTTTTATFMLDFTEWREKCQQQYYCIICTEYAASDTHCGVHTNFIWCTIDGNGIATKQINNKTKKTVLYWKCACILATHENQLPLITQYNAVVKLLLKKKHTHTHIHSHNRDCLVAIEYNASIFMNFQIQIHSEQIGCKMICC